MLLLRGAGGALVLVGADVDCCVWACVVVVGHLVGVGGGSKAGRGVGRSIMSTIYPASRSNRQRFFISRDSSFLSKEASPDVTGWTHRWRWRRGGPPPAATPGCAGTTIGTSGCVCVRVVVMHACIMTCRMQRNGTHQNRPIYIRNVPHNAHTDGDTITGTRIIEKKNNVRTKIRTTTWPRRAGRPRAPPAPSWDLPRHSPPCPAAPPRRRAAPPPQPGAPLGGVPRPPWAPLLPACPAVMLWLWIDG